MTRRNLVFRGLLALLGLPVALSLAAVVAFYLSFYPRDRANGTIVSAGQAREYLLYVPRSYDRTRPTPLVISLHAAMLWPGHQRDLSHWNQLADQYGFIVVYPSGLAPWGSGTGVSPKIWLWRPESVLVANLTFLSELIDTLEATYSIDPASVNANGFSNGGAMTFALSCRLSHRIAAVGTVSAAQDQLPSSWCSDARPMPLVNFHGTADLVPYTGGTVWASPNPFPSVLTWTAEWAHRNRCELTPVVSAMTADVARLEYTHCADGATVVLYTILGGGHSWPGGKPLPQWVVGPTNRSIDATRLMWAFFREHHLPPP
jgi:polyhydroxybutyrate depolymerase